MHRYTALSDASKDLDYYNIGQVIQDLPYDCYFNTRTGACYSAQDDDGVTAYRHSYCKKLSCRTCASKRKRELYDALASFPFTHYLVLTLPGDVQPSDIEPKLKKALPRFLQEANRILKPKRLSYYWALGVGVSGRLHANLLLDSDFSQAARYGKPVKKWHNKTWHHLTGACHVSLKKIDTGTSGNVINYILRDMFMTVLKIPGIRRREGCSRGIKLRAEKIAKADNYKWERLCRPTAHYAKLLGLKAMPVNGAFQVDPNAASAAQSPTLGEPSLEPRADAGGHGLPADGRAGVGTQLKEVLP